MAVLGDAVNAVTQLTVGDALTCLMWGVGGVAPIIFGYLAGDATEGEAIPMFGLAAICSIAFGVACYIAGVRA